MNPAALITAAILIGAILGAVAACVFQRYRSLRLSRRFGREYSRTIAETGSQWKAEAALDLRRKRARQLHIRPLDRSERKHFLDVDHAAVRPRMRQHRGSKTRDAPISNIF